MRRYSSQPPTASGATHRRTPPQLRQRPTAFRETSAPSLQSSGFSCRARFPAPATRNDHETSRADTFRRQSQRHSASGTHANARGRSRTLGRTRREHGPPPRPPLKTRTLRYAFDRQRILNKFFSSFVKRRFSSKDLPLVSGTVARVRSHASCVDMAYVAKTAKGPLEIRRGWNLRVKNYHVHILR